MRSRRGVLQVLILLTLTGVLVVGCDLTRIDEGANDSTADLISSLNSASTPERAEKALVRFMNKAEIGVMGRTSLTPGMYDAYVLKDSELRAIASAQAAYVDGDQSKSLTVRQLFDSVLEAQKSAESIMKKTPVTPVLPTRITAGVDEILAVLRSNARAALATPEASSNALTLAAIGQVDLKGDVQSISANTRLSPAQQFLFRVWLHRNGPSVYPFMKGGTVASKTADADPACKTSSTVDPCCGGTGKFVTITLQYLGTTSATIRGDVTVPQNSLLSGVFNSTVPPMGLFTITGAGLNSRPAGLRGTIGNQLDLFVNGSLSAQIHTSCSQAVLPGEIYGMIDPVPEGEGLFRVISVTTGSQGLCSDLDVCIDAAVARYQTCLEAAGDNAEAIEACRIEYKQNDQRCHDQGTSP